MRGKRTGAAGGRAGGGGGGGGGGGETGEPKLVGLKTAGTGRDTSQHYYWAGGPVLCFFSHVGLYVAAAASFCMEGRFGLRPDFHFLLGLLRTGPFGSVHKA